MAHAPSFLFLIMKCQNAKKFGFKVFRIVISRQYQSKGYYRVKMNKMV